MKYTLLASGTPTAGVLNVNITAGDEAEAREIAETFAKRLHLAGWYRFDLFAEQLEDIKRLGSFRTDTQEPTIQDVEAR